MEDAFRKVTAEVEALAVELALRPAFALSRMPLSLGGKPLRHKGSLAVFRP